MARTPWSKKASKEKGGGEVNPLRDWFAFEHAWAEAIFVALFPRTERIPVGAEDMDIRQYMKDSLASIPLEPVIGMRAAVWLVALSPIFVQKRLQTFTGLSAAERMNLLVALAKSPTYVVRQLAVALKAHGSFLYANDPRVLAAIFEGTAAPKFALPLVSVQRTRSSSHQAGAFDGV